MRTARLLLCAAVLSAGMALPALAASSGWAVVDATGALVGGSIAAGATHHGTGTYTVDFNHSVKKCAFTASVGDPGFGTAPAGYVTVASANGDLTGVYVAVFDRFGAPADIGFHLNVRC